MALSTIPLLLNVVILGWWCSVFSFHLQVCVLWKARGKLDQSRFNSPINPQSLCIHLLLLCMFFCLYMCIHTCIQIIMEVGSVTTLVWLGGLCVSSSPSGVTSWFQKVLRDSASYQQSKESNSCFG